MSNKLNLLCIASASSCAELKSLLQGCTQLETVSFVQHSFDPVGDFGLRDNQIVVIEYDKQARNVNELIPPLRSRFSRAKFIVLLSDEQMIWSVLASGANTFLIWPDTSLLTAIEGTVNNEYWIGPSLTKYLLQGDGLKHLRRTGSSIDFPDALPKLSTREREVVELLVEGLTNKEIADALNLKLGTVKVHVNHILAKLQLEHRGQAIAKISKLRAMV